MSKQSLRQKALSGAKWTSIEKFSTQLLQFVIGVIVARLVTPADFGVVGMLAIFIAFGNALLDSGFGTALIRQKEKNDKDYSTAFYFNVAVGFIVYILLYFTAPLIADFYQTPELEDITQIYGLILLINSLIVVQVSKLTAELRFKIQFIINSSALVVSGIVGISMAYNGFGVWAIVWQQLSNRILCAILTWIFARWRPLLCFSKQSFNKLFSFGSKMLALSFIDIIYDNIYTLTIGKFYAAQYVGYYTRSQQIVGVPQFSISQIVSKVSIPILSPYQDDNEKLLNVFDKIFRLTIFIAYPLLVGLVVLAKPLIQILLGEKWLPCVPYLQILSFGALWVSLTLINLNLFIVKGRSDILLKLGIIKKIIGFSIVAITINFGMYWICFGTTIYALCAFIINGNQTRKLLGYGIGTQLLTVLPIFIKSAVMGAFVLGVYLITDSCVIQIIVGFTVGVSVYFGLGFIIKDKSHIEFIKTIKK